MSKDVRITPLLGSINFNSDSSTKASIYELDGNLHIDSPNGSVLIDGSMVLGDGSAANIEIGDINTHVTMNFLGGADLTPSGNILNLGLSGDIINLNVAGVTYNLPSDIVRTSDFTDSLLLSKIKNVDGANSGLDSDLLDGQHGAYYTNFINLTNKPSPIITLAGDLTGSITLTELASGTLTAVVVDDSHNHIIGNVDGLQDALNLKVNNSIVSEASTPSTIVKRDTSGNLIVADAINYNTSASIKYNDDTKSIDFIFV